MGATWGPACFGWVVFKASPPHTVIVYEGLSWYLWCARFSKVDEIFELVFVLVLFLFYFILFTYLFLVFGLLVLVGWVVGWLVSWFDLLVCFKRVYQENTLVTEPDNVSSIVEGISSASCPLTVTYTQTHTQ